jgi:hypothetical protein
MYRFLLAIRDWLPSVAVIMGGIWVLFQWGSEEKRRQKEEKLRQQKEGPSLDGKLSATIIPCDDGRLLVTVEALWNNHSPLSIFLDLGKCRTVIFRIDSSKVKDGVLELKDADLGEPVFTTCFLQGEGLTKYFFEPKTKSTIMNHFVLQPGVYGIRMELFRQEASGKWWKELVVDLKADRSTTHQV